MAPTSAQIANTVGWFILEGYPWWPVYVCDQFKLRPNLYHLGDGHKRILKKARDFPNDYAIVYFFGSGEFSLTSLKKGVLKPWDCSERENFLKGHPKHLLKKLNIGDDLKEAIHAAEDYLSQPEDTRLPQYMVPSDLDPSLEPPPPMERPPVEDEEGRGEGGGEDGDGDEEMASDAEADGDDDGDAEGEEEDEDDGEKKKKKTKAKKSKASEKKEKKKENPKKEKKQPGKEKKESAKKKKTEDGDDAKDKSKLKRQRSSSSVNGAVDDEKNTKQIKEEKQSDVKTGSQKEETPEELNAVLEREMRWIISNCQYEEMTTKMVRKMLEERLKRDLRHHRDTIKAVVYRVMESMEDEEGGAEGEADAATETESKVKKEETDAPMEAPVVKTEEPTPEPVMDEVKTEEAVKNEPAPAPPAPPSPPQAEIDVKKLIEAKTELSLAVNDEKKIGDALVSLKKLPSVDKAQLMESGLLPKLVELRGHRKSSVANVVGELASLWKMEDEIPPPKPVQVEDILKLKEKLEQAETSHDELLATLNELEQMALELSHLKNTGIARSVAKLRQHANDKVSIAAKNLRNAWMQLADKDKQPDNLKTLVQMNEVLESETESEQAKLTVLKKLIKMSLTTQEIIESKIGVVVSKLRKSSHADVAAAANKLRKKWKSEVSGA